MGYSTQYSLEVTPLAIVTKPPKTIEQLMSCISQSQQIDKDALLEDLQQIAIQADKVVDYTEIIAELRATNENAEYALDDNGDTNDSCKWYDNEPEMKAFSKKHPNWLFTLKGVGEEGGDLWYKYFVNGKCQVAKAIITYDAFDKKKLTS